ncbi:acetylxylan esterase [candidate division KSB1 bacterium]
MRKLSRVLFSGLLIFVALSAGQVSILAAEDNLQVLSDRVKFPDPELMLYNHLSRLTAEELEKRQESIEELGSPSDWSGRQRYVLERVRASVGPFPPRTPLKTVITGVYHGDGYRVEKLIYESRPGLYVTANLYLPDPVTDPVPAFINPVGHWHQGKANETYRHLGTILALRGYAAFIYDPIGQGERLQYYNPDSGVSLVGGNIFPHNIVGKQCLLTDINLTNYFLWDGVRAIDYLETRPEIDASKIVCAGASGGGAQTQFLSPVDDRIKISIPVVSVGRGASTEPSPFRGGLGDNEQNLFWSLNHGIVKADWLGCLAPRPLFIIAASGDRGGTMAPGATFKEVRTLYNRFGADSLKVDEMIFYGQHGWPDEVVMATADWTDKWFGRTPRAVRLPVNPPPRDSVLCTETGQVMASLGGETILSLTQKRARQIAPAPAKIKNRKDIDRLVRETGNKIAELTGYGEPGDNPRVVKVGAVVRDGVEIEKIVYYPQPDIYVPALVFKPAGAKGRLPAVLYLPQGGGPMDGTAMTTTAEWNGPVTFETGGKERRAAPGGLLRSLAQSGCVVMAVDYSGIGETLVRPTTWDRNSAWFSPGNFGGDAGACYQLLKMGKTLFGLRLGDAVAGLKVLEGMEDVDSKRIGVAGRSLGGLLALYTAAIRPEVKAALVERSLASYGDLIATPLYYYHFNVFIPGVLGEYDLDQVAAMVAPRPLTFLNAVDQTRTRLSTDDAAQRYGTAQSVYKTLKRDGAQKFLTAEGAGRINALYGEWMNSGLD